ncbi:MAG: helix-turn-helix transcriptional regulator [Chitinophagaceae bacterium]|nr:helix-turn-helix transcriptional regulator [Chitinophagaceae bacterium]
MKSDRDRLERIREYILKNLDKTLNIKTLSTIFGVSAPTLRRQFHKYFHVPIYTYICQQRMEYAKELILAYTHTVYEISELVGYSESSNFSHAFTRYFGASPSRFIENNQK